MGRHEKLIATILRGTSDTNVRFDELCNLLTGLGFSERVKGSHHMFRKEGVADLINIQKDGSKAKAYQVKQVRSVLVEYKLIDEGDAEV